MSRIISQQAYLDYKYLRERGFPERASLKLVGDRYRLSTVGRNCLFRGAIPAPVAEARKAKLVTTEMARGMRLAVDWYNVLITVESYLKGSLVFLADDGVVRDAAASHGSWRRGSSTPVALEVLVGALAGLGLERLDVYLDSPIAFSGELASELRERFAEAGVVTFEVSLAPSADWPLKHHGGIIASSDSVVLDQAAAILDLPRVVLASRFGFAPPSLRDL
jgi:hypothetical protein